MKSYSELGDFINHWQKSAEYPPQNRGNTSLSFPISLIYESQGGRANAAFNTEVRIYVGSGPDDGLVRLYEAPGLTAELYHLDLSAQYQEYKFINSSGSLEVKGKSSKMGTYVVTITPTLQAP